MTLSLQVIMRALNIMCKVVLDIFGKPSLDFDVIVLNSRCIEFGFEVVLFVLKNDH